MGQATAAKVNCEGSKNFLAMVEWLAAFFDLRLNDVKPMCTRTARYAHSRRPAPPPLLPPRPLAPRPFPS